MRIRIIQRPPPSSIDGIRLDRFEPGQQYEVGNSLGAVFLAEGWAEPVDLDETPAVVPFSDSDPFDARRLYRARTAKEKQPFNLVRETFPPSPDRIHSAAELRRRRKKKRDRK